MNIKTKHVIAVCVLSSMLAAGCSSQKTETATGGTAASASPQTQAQQAGQNQQGQGHQGDAQGNAGFSAAMTFQALIQMDKTDGLSITKDQATAMLPVVQAAISSGSLTTDADTKLKEKLTDAQKKFLTEQANAMPQRGDGGSGGAKAPDQNGKAANGSASGANAAPAGSPPAGQQGKQGGPGGGGQGPQGGAAANGSQAQQAGTSGSNASQGQQGQQGQGSPGGGRGQMNLQTVGQQLVELLQAKQK